MDIPMEVLHKARLFEGFSDGELARLLAWLSPAVKSCGAGQVLLAAGSGSSDIGVVLAGQIEAAKYTRGGARFTVAGMGPGGVFGDILAGGSVKSPVTVTAAAASRVLLLPAHRLFFESCPQPALQRRLLANLAAVIADKYFALDARIDLLLQPSLRRRLAAYLLDAGRGHGEESFAIPYDRAGLAAYLGCERSALSRELSRMAKEGLIETQRSRFRIPSRAALHGLF